MSVQFVDRLYLWSSLSSLLLFLLALVGLGSPAWRAGNYGKRQYVQSGLIMRCHHDLRDSYHRCAPFTLDPTAAWFDVCRVFCAISLVLLFTLIIAAIFLHVTDKKRHDYLYLVVGAVITGLIGSVGAVLFAVRSADLLDHYDADLSWGWAVFLVTHLLLIIVFIAFFIVIRKTKSKPKSKAVAPTREIIF